MTEHDETGAEEPAQETQKAKEAEASDAAEETTDDEHGDDDSSYAGDEDASGPARRHP